ncbi:MAG: rhodanese-like domain-containing protein [Negativicutes bacterium]
MRLSKKLLLIAIPLLLIAGCGAQPPSQTPVQQKAASPQVALAGSPFSLLRQETDRYLKSNRILAIDAQAVYEKAVVNADSSYYLVDVRSDEHYAKHHIPGSVHIAYADTWRPNKTEFLPRDKKIVVIDYSGHSSSQVAALWSMMGFDAVAMKHGMAGWSKDKEVIGGSPIPCEPKNFAVVKDAAPAGNHEFPALDIKSSTLQELLQLSAENATGKTVVIQADDVLAKVTAKNAFVLDVRATEHYNAGHIAGAVNIPFRSLMEEESLKKLSPSQQIIIVCYDGHAASQATRVLNQLGYNAVAMRDGMSLWTGDISVIGAKAIACTIPERLTAHLNAPLNPGPSTAAT